MSTRIFGTDLVEISPHAFTRVVERLLWHLDFYNISNVDGAGDGGADLVALRVNPQSHFVERWAFQAKSKRTHPVDDTAVDEICAGMQKYNAHHGVVVTNTTFTSTAKKRVDALKASFGIDVSLWGRNELVSLYASPGFRNRFSTPDLRRYQADAIQACWYDLTNTRRALAVLATGLGKTIIAGALIDRFCTEGPGNKVLVLADKIELVDQLEKALWRQITKGIPTQQILGGQKPERLDGITVATIQSGIEYARQGFRPDMIFVDEAHHVGKDTQFSELLEICSDAIQLGATATPWRGDKFDIAEFFGPASVKIGIEEGMRLGYLADVDYRLYADNINWDYVRTLSANSYSIGDLNRNLFLPQRDERIRDELLEVWFNIPEPRGIVFCNTVEHAESLLKILKAVPVWRKAETIHSQTLSAERKSNLAKFRLGDIPLLVAVDVLNEGVDVPDVNIVCFARVTHSRRIFIQQLGRGLRLREGKTKVVVLDFVSDLKRMKAVLDLKAQVVGEREDLILPSSHSINFTDTSTESLFKEWLYDAANLDTAADEVRLNFPPFPQ